MSTVREIWERNCDTLEPRQQEELWQVLSEFQDIFALTHLVQHEIDIGDAQPIKMRPWCFHMAHQAADDIAIEEMQRAGILLWRG